MDYAWEKLTSAAHALAGPEPVKTRVLNAFLNAHALRGENFLSEEERTRWSSIRDRFSIVQDAERGSAEASVEAMSEEMAARVAHDFIELLGFHTMAYVDAEKQRRLGG